MDDVRRDPVIAAYDLFYDAGIPVYLPNQHQGIVKEPHVVIFDNGRVSTRRTVGSSRIDVIIHVPQDDYVEGIRFKNKVRRLMKCLNTQFKPTGYESPFINDDYKKSYTSLIAYAVYRDYSIR